MIATPDLVATQPPRLLPGKRLTRPNVRLIAAGMGWLALFVLLALTITTLWRTGVISSELLFWEARRRLILDLRPADLTTLVSTDPALVLFLLLPAGPVSGGAALLGTIAVVLVSALRRWAGLGALWLPLLVIQPALALALFQYPSVVVQATLLLVTLACLLAYLRGPRVVLILSAALSLGALTLVDAAIWPVWIYLGAVLWFSHPMPTNERLSLLMVTFFPALFLLLAWQYLGWTMNVSRSHLADGPALLFAAWPDRELARAWPAPSSALVGLGASVTQLLVYAPAYLLAVVLVLRTGRSQMDGGIWPALVLLTPAADLLFRSASGHAQPAPLDAVLPSLTVLLAAGMLGHRARRVLGLVLLAGALVGWGSLLRADSSEPARLTRQATGLTSADPLRPIRELASAVDAHAGAGDVILVDDATLYPLIALVREPASLLLPYRPRFSLTIQQPERFAAMIVTTDPERFSRGATTTPGALSSVVPGYCLVSRSGRVHLYERAAQEVGMSPPAVATCSPVAGSPSTR